MTLRYTRVPSGLLDGLREAGSIGPTIQAVNTSNLYRRREAMCLGLNTFEDGTASTANDFADRKYQLQPFVVGAGARNFVATGHTKFAAPRFVAAFLVVGTHDLVSSAISVVPADRLNNYIAEGSVTLGVSASQTGVGIGSVTSTGNVLQYWPASMSDASPYLQTIAAMRTDPSGAAMGYRAGLVDIGRGSGRDVDLMQVVTLSFDAATFDRNLPCDFEIAIEQLATAPYPQWGPGSDLQSPDDPLLLSQLRLDVVGFSIFAQSRI